MLSVRGGTDNGTKEQVRERLSMCWLIALLRLLGKLTA
jgi:hypothetical protein